MLIINDKQKEITGAYRCPLVGKNADQKIFEAIRKAVDSPETVIETVGLPAMHFAPKQILVKAHVDL